jgi:hypothetical protein
MLQVSPYIGKIIEHFKTLWKACEPNDAYNLVKQSIVTALTKLVQVAITLTTNNWKVLHLRRVELSQRHNTATFTADV